MRRRFFLLSALLTIGLLVGQAAVFNLGSTGGGELAEVRGEIEKLEKKNKVLEEKIAQLSSLTKISPEALRLGYFPAQVVYTSFDIPVAMSK